MALRVNRGTAIKLDYPAAVFSKMASRMLNYLHALWLTGEEEDRVAIVDRGLVADGLERLRWYSSREFLDALARTPRAQGVPEVGLPNQGQSRL